MPLESQGEGHKILNKDNTTIILCKDNKKVDPEIFESRLIHKRGGTNDIGVSVIGGATYHFPMTHAEEFLKIIRPKLLFDMA